jgi:hypothetical protein
MLGKCRSCGVRTVIVGSLCALCLAGASAPADASVVSAPHHVAMVAMPPTESELPHVAEEEFLTHVPTSDVSAGGGGRVVQGAAALSGKGHLQAGGAVSRVGSSSLSGSGSLTAGGVIIPAARLVGEGSLIAG